MLLLDVVGALEQAGDAVELGGERGTDDAEDVVALGGPDGDTVDVDVTGSDGEVARCLCCYRDGRISFRGLATYRSANW